MQADSTGAGKSLRTIIAMRPGHSMGVDGSLSTPGKYEIEHLTGILQKEFNIQKIFSSPTVRGTNTAGKVSKLYDDMVPVFPVKALGEKPHDHSDILTLLREQPQDVDTILLVTHEWLIDAMAVHLYGYDLPMITGRHIQGRGHPMETGTAVVMTFNGDWSELSRTTMQDLKFVDQKGVRNVALDKIDCDSPSVSYG